MRLKRKKKGFTLIEMVIVIAIMGILIGLVSPSAMKSIKEARVNSDIANAKSIATAIIAGQANGDITFDDSAVKKENAKEIVTDESDEPDGISEYLQSVPEPKAVKGGSFAYYVDNNDQIHIIVTTGTGADDEQWELYPTLDSDYPNEHSSEH